jgi:hypothetical protein
MPSRRGFWQPATGWRDEPMPPRRWWYGVAASGSAERADCCRADVTIERDHSRVSSPPRGFFGLSLGPDQRLPDLREVQLPRCGFSTALMRGRNTTSRRTSSRRVGTAAAPFVRSERTGGRKSPVSCWTRASSRASATSSRTRCCSARGPARSRKSTDSRPPSCEKLPTRRAYSPSASSSCGGSSLCASTWKSMDVARARRARAKFPARSTASVAAAVFSARSASTRVYLQSAILGLGEA